MLASIQTMYPPDIILVTGNLVSRDPFLTDAEVQTSFKDTLTLIKTEYPTTPVFVSVGATEFGPNQQ